MIFSEIKKLEEEYYEWLKKPLNNEKIKDCPISLISFLDIKGILNSILNIEPQLEINNLKERINFLIEKNIERPKEKEFQSEYQNTKAIECLEKIVEKYNLRHEEKQDEFGDFNYGCYQVNADHLCQFIDQRIAELKGERK